MKKATTNTEVNKTTAKAAVKKTTTKKAATRKSPVRKTATKAKAKGSTSPDTRISARTDIGFGNILYLRGDGPGLSWEHGVPMDCDKNSVWNWTAATTAKAFTYKVLVNDVSWSVGEDFVAHPGMDNKTHPAF